MKVSVWFDVLLAPSAITSGENQIKALLKRRVVS